MLMQVLAEAMSSWVGSRESSPADCAEVNASNSSSDFLCGRFCNIVLGLVVVCTFCQFLMNSFLLSQLVASIVCI